MSGPSQSPEDVRWYSDPSPLERCGDMPTTVVGTVAISPAVPARSRDHQAGRNVERREQVSSAMPDIVMRPLLGHTGHHRQYRLGPVKGLHLGLLVYAQHDRVLGRIQVQPGNIVDLLHEQRIG